jgi:hypothetical protein
MRTLLPWLAAFGFGAIVFLVGKFLQSIEKKQRQQQKLKRSPFGITFGSSVTFKSSTKQLGDLGPYPGPEKKPQEKPVH